MMMPILMMKINAMYVCLNIASASWIAEAKAGSYYIIKMVDSDLNDIAFVPHGI